MIKMTIHDIPERDLEGWLAQAVRIARGQEISDSEYAKPRATHLHEIIVAFAVGVLEADTYHRPYSMPPHFADVLDELAKAVQARWRDDFVGVVEISLNDLRNFYAAFVQVSGLAQAWNDYPYPVKFVTIYDKIPARRDFIDLDALVNNAVRHVRDQRRLYQELEGSNARGEETGTCRT